ncbi:MAG: damage-inducible protein, partial [Mesorhizobium sp.]
MGQPAASPAIAALRERVARLEGGPARNRATLPFGVPT